MKIYGFEIRTDRIAKFSTKLEQNKTLKKLLKECLELELGQTTQEIHF